MSELRQRQAQAPKGTSESPSKPRSKSNKSSSNENGISVLDIIRLLVTLVAASCGLSYYITSSESLLWGYRPWFTKWPLVVRYIQGPIFLTPEQLSLYNGTDPNLPIYLALNGTIFDVSANPRIYGPGGMYGFFAGRDAARAFVTGCFEDDLTSDLAGVEEMFIPIDDEDSEEEKKLTKAQKKIRRERDVRLAKAEVRKHVEHWQNFYRDHKKYFEVGKVVGQEVVDGGKRELCDAAKSKRPKRDDQDVDGKD